MVELLPQSCNVEKVKLKCSQEGKVFTVKIRDLSREDMQPLSNSTSLKVLCFYATFVERCTMSNL